MGKKEIKGSLRMKEEEGEDFERVEEVEEVLPWVP